MSACTEDTGKAYFNIRETKSKKKILSYLEWTDALGLDTFTSYSYRQSIFILMNPAVSDESIVFL